MKKRIIKIGFIFLLLFLTYRAIIGDEEIASIPAVVELIDLKYILLAIMCMVLHWTFDGLAIRKIVRMVNYRLSFLQSLKVVMIGQYYGLITPISSGTQPAQIVTMSRYSIPAGKATSVSIIKIAAYQVILVFYSLIALVIKYNFIRNTANNAIILIIIGMLFNLFCTAFLVALFFRPIHTEKFISFLFKKIKNIKVFNKLEKYEEKLKVFMDEYIKSINDIKGNKEMYIVILLLVVMQLTAYFSVNYFVLLSLGFSEIAYIDAILIQSLINITISAIPVPGRIGSSEGTFYLFFNNIIASDTLTYAIILWRVISFYFDLFACGIVTLSNYSVVKLKKVKMIKWNIGRYYR